MRILVTGSTDGLGHYAADSLLSGGHNVVVHARNPERAASLDPLVRRGAELVVGDLRDGEAVRRMASELNGRSPLDSVIHNAGVEHGTAVIPVNVVAPYLLTLFLDAPQRHIYISSGSHFSGKASLTDVDWRGDVPGSYADSKLLVTVMAAAFARLRPDVLSNAVDPGWVATKMGGPGGSEDFDSGTETQVWLATSQQAEALTSGGYWYHGQRRQPHRAVHDHAFQEQLLQALAASTGIDPPSGVTRN